jgi:nucleoside-diphosphate-sugar epimerase
MLVTSKFSATESLVEAMLNSNVQNLIYLSCAYANIPCEDNFGNSEEIHDSTPSSFMLGRYGETRTKAELFVRRKVGTKMANGWLTFDQ